MMKLVAAISSHSGSMYNPAAVAAWLKILHEKRYRFNGLEELLPASPVKRKTSSNM
jgi:hypothetical protein